MTPGNIKTIENYILHAALLTKQPKGVPIDLWLPLHGEGSFDGAYLDGTPECTTLPLRVCLAVPYEQCIRDGWEGMVSRTLRHGTFKDIRGIPCGPARHIVVHDFTALEKKRVLRSRFYFTSMDGRNWRSFNQHGNPVGGVTNSADFTPTRMIGFHYGYQCFDEYFWHAEIEFESGAPSVKVSIHDEMLPELLALRDLPPGAAKRDKTIHFVCSHKRGSAENSTEVAKHLRGATDHLWQGCRMRILPPVNGTAPLKKTAKVKQVIGLLQGEE